METTATFIYNQSDIETAQPVSVAELTAAARRKAARLTAPRIYRAELTLYRRVAQLIDRHPIVSNSLLAAQVLGFIYYVFMYA